MTDKMQVMDKIRLHADEMKSLGIARVGLFGSVVRGEAKSGSDVDLLLEFVPGEKNYQSFVKGWDLLESILGRSVDVVTPEGLSPYVKPHVDREVVYVQIR